MKYCHQLLYVSVLFTASRIVYFMYTDICRQITNDKMQLNVVKIINRYVYNVKKINSIEDETGDLRPLWFNHICNFTPNRTYGHQ